MPYRVFVSSRGNAYMREIAEHLAEALHLDGQEATVCTEGLPGGGDPYDDLVVAPHEFFGLHPAGEADRVAAAQAAVCVNTEQPGTPFFESAMHYAALGPVVLDINPQSLRAVRARGLGAVHLPLGYVASMDAWGGRADCDRPVDLLMLAGRTPRREEFVGGAGRMLWEWRTELRMFSWHRPVVGPTPGFVQGREKYELMARSRLLLNVHRGAEPYFEWARVIEAMANGCAVVTEPALDMAPLVAGEHLLVAPIEHLAEQAVALAFDEARRRDLAAAAYDLLRHRLAQQQLLAAALAEARAAPRPRPARAERVRSALRAGRGRAVAAGRRLLAPEPDPRRAELEQHAAGLKRAYLAQLRVARQAERSLAAVRHGDPDHATLLDTPAWADAAPTVSVVVPLFHQGRFLAEAVGSVVGAAGGDAAWVELVVVDDHSRDDSAEVAAGLLAAHPWLPARLVRRSANGGLPVARNTGFAHARGRYVFALDADNAVYPCSLRVLADHLDGAPPEVVAAYGILERFDDTGSIGVTSHLPWDVDLLVQGAYIDAMAMIRRDAWETVGGYADDDGIHGWEDYDLWLAFAERGWRADLVPRVVGRYREHAGSMRRISDVDMAANFSTLRVRHPRLPWPS